MHQLLDYLNDHRFYDYSIGNKGDNWFSITMKHNNTWKEEKVTYTVSVDAEGCHLKYRTFAPLEWIKVTSSNMINHFNGEFAHVKKAYDKALYIKALKQQGWR